MKPDYLSRKVTINRSSFATLCSEITKDLVMNADGPEAAIYALSLGLMQARLSDKLGLLFEEPQTLSAADFGSAVFDHLRDSYYAGTKIAAPCGIDGANTVHLGIDAMTAMLIAEKLFGKDEDFETPPNTEGGAEA